MNLQEEGKALEELSRRISDNTLERRNKKTEEN